MSAAHPGWEPVAHMEAQGASLGGLLRKDAQQRPLAITWRPKVCNNPIVGHL